MSSIFFGICSLQGGTSKVYVHGCSASIESYSSQVRIPSKAFVTHSHQRPRHFVLTWMLEKTLCEITHADTFQFPMIKSRMNLIAKCGGYKCDQKFIYNKQCIIEYFPLSTNNYRLSPPGNKFTSRTEVVVGVGGKPHLRWIKSELNIYKCLQLVPSWNHSLT